MMVVITPRQINLGLLGLLILGTGAAAILDIASGTVSLISYVALLIFGMLFWATWQRWAYTSYALVVIVTVLFGIGIQEPYVTREVSLSLLVPVIVALALVGPGWVLGCGVAALMLILIRAGWQGAYASPFVLIVYGICVGGLIIGRLVATSATYMAEQARLETEAAAAALRVANASLEQRVIERTAAMQAALHEVETRMTEQALLLDENERQRAVIRELSVPVLPIGNAMLVMPLVGVLDRSRLELVQAQALQHIEQEHARYLLLDVTGVPVIDDQIGQGLLSVVQAARLLGTQVALVGIRAEVAQTIVGLALRLEGIHTFASLRDGIQRFNQREGKASPTHRLPTTRNPL